MPKREISIIAGSTGKQLAQAICDHLDIQPTAVHLGHFSDGELDVQIEDNVRGRDVFIVMPLPPPGDNILELVLLGKAARGSSAGRLTLVIPYLGYNRQDRKDRPRVPVSAFTIIDMLKLTNAERALLLDTHSEATVAHFDPLVVDHLYGSYTAVPYIKQRLGTRPYVIASPDTGGAGRVRKYARYLGGADFVIFSKERSAPGHIDPDSIRIVGDVSGRDVVFIDDMIDSGETLKACALAAQKANALDMYAFATHGIFSKGLAAFRGSPFKEIVVTDSLDHSRLTHAAGVNIRVLSIASLFADAIKRINEEQSLTELILK